MNPAGKRQKAARALHRGVIRTRDYRMPSTIAVRNSIATTG
jgi:hypothetical protein